MQERVNNSMLNTSKEIPLKHKGKVRLFTLQRNFSRSVSTGLTSLVMTFIAQLYYFALGYVQLSCGLHRNS